MQSKRLLNAAATLTWASIVMPLSACGVIKELTQKDHQQPYGQPSAEVMAEYGSLISRLFNPEEFFKVSTVEKTDGKGVVTDRDTFTYAGDETAKSVHEYFLSDGKISSRYTYIYSNTDSKCQKNYQSRSEYLSSSTPSVTESRYEYICDADGRTLEEHSYNTKDSSPEVEIRKTIYTLDTAGHKTKEVYTSNDQDGKLIRETTTDSTYDAAGHQLTEIIAVKDAVIQKTIFDPAADTEQTFVPSDSDSKAITKESNFKRRIHDSNGKKSIFPEYAEGRDLDSSNNLTAVTCNFDGTQLKCSETRKSQDTQKTTRNKDSIKRETLVPISAALASFLPDYVKDGKLIWGYSTVEESIKDVSADGKESITTEKNEFNDIGNTIKTETTKIAADSSKSTTVETYTFDMDGQRPLTKVTTTDGVMTQTTKYNY